MTHILKSHWAAVTVFSMVILGFVIAQFESWDAPRLLEASLLIDLAILAPLLLTIGYWKAHTPKQRLLRGLGAVALGISLVAWLIPQQHHFILNVFEPLRDVFEPFRAIFAVLFVLAEAWIFWTVVKALFFSGSREEMEASLADKDDLPPYLKKLLVAEVTFWKWVARKITFRK